MHSRHLARRASQVSNPVHNQVHSLLLVHHVNLPGNHQVSLALHRPDSPRLVPLVNQLPSHREFQVHNRLLPPRTNLLHNHQENQPANHPEFQLCSRRRILRLNLLRNRLDSRPQSPVVNLRPNRLYNQACSPSRLLPANRQVNRRLNPHRNLPDNLHLVHLVNPRHNRRRHPRDSLQQIPLGNRHDNRRKSLLRNHHLSHPQARRRNQVRLQVPSLPFNQPPGQHANRPVNRPDHQLCNQVIYPLRSLLANLRPILVGSRLGNQLVSLLCNLSVLPLANQLRNQVDNRLPSLLHNPVLSRHRNHLTNQLLLRLANLVDVRLRSLLNSLLRNQLLNRLVSQHRSQPQPLRPNHQMHQHHSLRPLQVHGLLPNPLVSLRFNRPLNHQCFLLRSHLDFLQLSHLRFLLLYLRTAPRACLLHNLPPSPRPNHHVSKCSFHHFSVSMFLSGQPSQPTSQPSGKLYKYFNVIFVL